LFACDNCSHVAARWSAKCVQCSAWMPSTKGKVVAQEAPRARPKAPQSAPRRRDVNAEDEDDDRPVVAPLKQTFEHAGWLPGQGPSVPVPITKIANSEAKRWSTGIEPLDLVLGGGLVVGSSVILGGDPGIGKSTLLIQALASIKCGVRLYASGEEAEDKIAGRAHRVGAADERIQVVNETDPDAIIAHARAIGADVVAVDSVQTLCTPEIPSIPGSILQVKECVGRLARFALQSGTSVILVSHVNKDGQVSGPNTLKHLVDAVFELEINELFPSIRHLLSRSRKNRHGDTSVIGTFEMLPEGLRPVPQDEAREHLGALSGDQEEENDAMRPVAQEILYRFLELGGEVDADLRDRIAGRLDLVPRSKPA